MIFLNDLDDDEASYDELYEVEEKNNRWLSFRLFIQKILLGAPRYDAILSSSALQPIAGPTGRNKRLLGKLRLPPWDIDDAMLLAYRRGMRWQAIVIVAW